jgi:hypothetical protein
MRQWICADGRFVNLDHVAMMQAVDSGIIIRLVDGWEFDIPVPESLAADVLLEMLDNDDGSLIDLPYQAVCLEARYKEIRKSARELDQDNW